MLYNIINYNIIFKINKSLKKGIKSVGGRNYLGRICVRGRGNCLSSAKTIYRFLDFYRRIDKRGKILNIYYDSNRTGKIGLVLYENGLSSFILLQKNIRILDNIYSGSNFLKKNINIGDSLVIDKIPLFTVLSNIENKPYKGGTICRASNTGALLISKNSSFGVLKLNSGWQLQLPLGCISSVGVVSNKWNKSIIGKAGKNRGIGIKSKVRGVAKNPCDHPHGGGNGKKSKPLHISNAWKTVFKWIPTNKKRIDIIKKRLYKNIN